MAKALLICTHLAILLSLSFVGSSQQFACDGQLLIATSDGTSTQIGRPIYIPFSPPFMSPFVKYTNQVFDGLGFNSKDNFIYGVRQNSNEIFRLKKDNSSELVGVVPDVDILNSNAGDCTPEGLYICHDHEINKLLVFQVVDGFKLLRSIDLYWDSNGSNTGTFQTRLFDFAIDPNQPSIAYAYQGSFPDPDLVPAESRGYLLQINLDFDSPDLGMVSTLGPVDENILTHLGGLVFSPDSNLFGFGSQGSGLIPTQNTFYSINPYTNTVNPQIITNPPAILSDGCSCPYSFSFTNIPPQTGILCNGDRQPFLLTIENNSYNSIENIILSDTFPEGTIIEKIDGDFEGQYDLGTGVGTNILRIKNFTIPAKTKIELSIEIMTIDAKIGETYNQAFLDNLPPRFEDKIGSDQLGTSIIGDPSLFAIVARDLEDLTWEITPASDCILANDAKIKFTSPQFSPGQGFEIGMINKVGWESSLTEVIVDNDGSFTLDSIDHGEYQIFSFRSLSENCSLALRDTTVKVDPPNQLLSLQASTNSPLCEGSTIILDGTASPSGNIRWTGPTIYGSDLPYSEIQESMPEQSGTYKVMAQYGFCEQKQTFEVEVFPEVKISIDGKNQYCERDEMILSVHGEGSLTYQWTVSDKTQSLDSNLIIPNLTAENAGVYKLVSSNGACFDTAKINIDILPTPTIALDDLIKTDFCEPLILSPIIHGDTDVDYLWQPPEGLDCIDCPNPTISPIVQSEYKLLVTNEYSCTDSSSIIILLDKSKILYAPNVFQLASTSGNNKFSPTPGCIVDYIESINVVDRLGNTVFRSEASSNSDILESWNGFVNGQNSSVGVYIWFAKVILVDGSIQYLSGDITLL